MRSSTVADAPTNQLEDMLARPDREVNLAEAALLMAAEEYPDLDVAATRSGWTRWAAPCASASTTSRARARGHGAQPLPLPGAGFHGNTEEYYDPRNSYLNEVLDRRTGIPITLSTVYIEVARRGGLEVEGVGLPGHFIVRVQTPARGPARGSVPRRDAADREGLPERLDRIFGGRVKLEPKMLRPAAARTWSSACCGT